jgi:hypothetical protein
MQFPHFALTFTASGIVVAVLAQFGANTAWQKLMGHIPPFQFLFARL